MRYITENHAKVALDEAVRHAARRRETAFHFLNHPGNGDFYLDTIRQAAMGGESKIRLTEFRQPYYSHVVNPEHVAAWLSEQHGFRTEMGINDRAFNAYDYVEVSW